MSAPVKVFFQEILIGDLKKQKAKSNTAKTGGGARDLRVPKAYEPFIIDFFPDFTEGNKYREGTVYWQDNLDKENSSSLELWEPTKARSGELRISKIHEISAWKIDENQESEFLADLKNQKKWFYILVVTENQKIWAKILTNKHLLQAEQQIKESIIERIKNNTRGSVRGIFDYKTGRTYP